MKDLIDPNFIPAPISDNGQDDSDSENERLDGWCFSLAEMEPVEVQGERENSDWEGDHASVKCAKQKLSEEKTDYLDLCAEEASEKAMLFWSNIILVGVG